MHYKIYAADQMAQSCGEFDTRKSAPDLAILSTSGFDWRDLVSPVQRNPVIFAEKTYRYYNNLMIGDQCATSAGT
jgi:hypothetical protein